MGKWSGFQRSWKETGWDALDAIWDELTAAWGS
jgi:hypothetical protein